MAARIASGKLARAGIELRRAAQLTLTKLAIVLDVRATRAELNLRVADVLRDRLGTADAGSGTRLHDAVAGKAVALVLVENAVIEIPCGIDDMRDHVAAADLVGLRDLGALVTGGLVIALGPDRRGERSAGALTTANVLSAEIGLRILLDRRAMGGRSEDLGITEARPCASLVCDGAIGIARRRGDLPIHRQLVGVVEIALLWKVSPAIAGELLQLQLIRAEAVIGSHRLAHGGALLTRLFDRRLRDDAAGATHEDGEE